MALDYATLERKLGEVDRARAIFAHGAALENPKRAPDFWKAWHEFEVGHGNEDTFRDMLRVKRTVLTSFANETFYDMAGSEAAPTSDAEHHRALQGQAQGQGGQALQAPLDPEAMAMQKLPAYMQDKAADPMAAAEALAAHQQMAQEGAGPFAGGMKRKLANTGAELDALERQEMMIRAAKAQGAPAAAAAPAPASNPEEIDLDDEDEEAEDEGAAGDVAQRAVPAGVFGEGLAAFKAEAEAKKAAAAE